MSELISIIDFVVDPMCYDTLPCQHIVTIKYSNNTYQEKIMFSYNIKEMYKTLNIINTDFKCI